MISRNTSVWGRIRGVSEPQGLAFIPEKKHLLACSRGDGTCRSFDANTFEEGPWVDLGRNADNVRFDNSSKMIYVGSGGEPGNGLLSALELASLLPAKLGGQPAEPHSPADFLFDRPRQAEPKMEIQLPAHPESFQFDPANRRIYVNVPDEHRIAVLEVTPTNLVVAANWPVTVAEKNFPMTLDAASGRLYIACRKPPRLAGYDTRTGKQLSQTPCVGDADDMFFDAKLKRIYIIGGEGFVEVFQVPDNGGEPTRLARVANGAAGAHRFVHSGFADAGGRPAAHDQRPGGGAPVPRRPLIESSQWITRLDAAFAGRQRCLPPQRASDGGFQPPVRRGHQVAFRKVEDPILHLPKSVLSPYSPTCQLHASLRPSILNSTSRRTIFSRPTTAWR